MNDSSTKRAAKIEGRASYVSCGARARMSGGIFISYRRGEGGASAGRLYDRLERDFARHQLFFDVDAIPPGVDFVELLHREVDACDVLLVVMGRGWLDIRDEEGARRLDNSEDFVRIEVARGLSAGKRVIPVLVDGALMPRADLLPEQLRPLTRRNAVRLAHESFKTDCERLVRSLKDMLAEIETGRRSEHARQVEAARLARQAIEDAQAKIIRPAKVLEQEAQASDGGVGLAAATRRAALPDPAAGPARPSAAAPASRSAPSAPAPAARAPRPGTLRRLTTVFGVTVALVLGVWLAPKLFFGWYGGVPAETSGEGSGPALKTDVQSPSDRNAKPGADETKGVRQIEVTKAANGQSKTQPIPVEDQQVTTSKVGVERSELPAPDPSAKSAEEPKAFDPDAIGKFLQGLEQ
jgi:hypothetical protein